MKQTACFCLFVCWVCFASRSRVEKVRTKHRYEETGIIKKCSNFLNVSYEYPSIAHKMREAFLDVEEGNLEVDSGENNYFILTYDHDQANPLNTASQIQNILQTASLASSLRLGYLHPHLVNVGFSAISVMMTNSKPESFHHLKNLFNISSFNSHDCSLIQDQDGGYTDSCVHVKAKENSLRELSEFMRNNRGRKVVFHLSMPFRIINEQPLLGRPPQLSFHKELPWIQKRFCFGNCRALRIVLHIKRGSLYLLDQARLLPNGYYISMAQLLGKILTEMGIQYIYEIHTEQVQGDITATVQETQANSAVTRNITLSPKDNRLPEYAVLQPQRLFVNADPLMTLQRLATASILVMSRSSFSYVGGLLHDPGVGLVIYFPFYHKPMPDWVALSFNETTPGVYTLNPASYQELRTSVRLKFRHECFFPGV